MAVVLIAQTEEVQALVRTATAELSAKKLLGAIGFVQLRWIKEQFRTEGRAGKLGIPSGIGGLSFHSNLTTAGGWKPLSPNTIAARRKGRRRGTPRILRDTGRMAQSFVMETREAQLAVEVGTSDPRATWHHFGTRPYTIRPRNVGSPGAGIGGLAFHQRIQGRPLLAFIVAGPNGPRTAFAREVRHPGLPARPILPSGGQASRMAEDVLRAVVARIDRA